MYFRDMLAHYRRGILLSQADEELAALVKAVLATKKGGELTLKVKINPSKTGDNELSIKAEVSAKVPKKTLPDAVFYGDEKNGEVHRDDPKQIDAFDEDGKVASLDRSRRELNMDAAAAAMGAG